MQLIYEELIYGTTNPAKIAQVRDVLEPVGYVVRSLADFRQSVLVDEDGKTAEENAHKKAMAYAAALELPVLSMDVALYFNDLPKDAQPGLHVRRIAGKERASDQEMLAHYTELAASMGHRINAHWHYAFALAEPSGDCVSFTHNTPRIFVSTPSKQAVAGFPLESLQIDPGTGRYISEMSKPELARFWRSSIGTPLIAFMEANF